jgi:DNA-binding response OmpR family regulator
MGMERRKVLIVDDDREIVDLIELYLAGESYDILKAYDGQEGLAILARENVSLLALDVMMPRLDGIAVCRRAREKSNIPIILITAKAQPLERVLGLAAGADESITKPFHPLELVARIKAQMRRYTELNPYYGSDGGAVAGGEGSGGGVGVGGGMGSGAREGGGAVEEIIVKDLVISPAEHTVTRNEEQIQLTPKEFKILCLLARHRGQVFSSEQLFASVWREEAFEQDNTVMVHIRKLRDKLGDDARKPKYIYTVWGVGYKIEK